MSDRVSVEDVAKSAGCHLATAALHTPQGQAAVVATAAAAVAAAPIVAGAAVGVAAAWVVGKFINLVDSL